MTTLAAPTQTEEPISDDLFAALHKLRAKAHAAKPSPEELAAEQAKQAQAAAKRREEFWADMVASKYRETDLAHPDLHPTALHALAAWDPEGAKGLGLIGRSGLGKTRVLTIALERLLSLGRTVLWVSHIDLAKAATDAHAPDTEPAKRDAARQLMRRSLRVDDLMLDDLGKAAPTERGKEAVAAIVEGRTACGLRILWSAQAGGDWLEKRFGADHGPAIVRRLSEFCWCPDMPRTTDPEVEDQAA